MILVLYIALAVICTGEILTIKKELSKVECDLTKLLHLLQRSLPSEDQQTVAIINTEENGCDSHHQMQISISCSDDVCSEISLLENWSLRLAPPLIILIGPYSRLLLILHHGFNNKFFKPKNKFILVIAEYDIHQDNSNVFLPTLDFTYSYKNIKSITLHSAALYQTSNLITCNILVTTLFSIRYISKIPKKDRNFKGVTLKVAFNILEPNFFKGEEEEDGFNYKGIYVNLLRELSKYLNFQINYVSSADGDWGGLVNGSWTGLTGLVDRRQVDAAVSAITMTPQRSAVVDFTIPYQSGAYSFVSPLPALLPPWESFIMPFDKIVWSLLIVSAVVTGIFIKILHDLSYKIGQIENVFNKTHKIIMFLGSCLTKQAIIHPLNNSTRMYTITWLFFCLVVTSSYSGILTSFLTTPLTRPPITTLQQVIDTELPVTAVYRKGSRKEMFYMFQPTRVIFDKLVFVGGYDESFHYVGSGSSVFVEYDATLRYLKRKLYGRQLKPVVTFGKVSWAQQCYGIALQKGSPYKEEFDRAFSYFSQAGLMHKWKLEFLATTHSIHHSESTTKVLTLRDLSTCFYILIIFSIFYFIIFSTEILVYKYKCRHCVLYK